MKMWPAIFHWQIQLMKDMLERGEMIFKGDRKNAGYVKFKQETMRVHYQNIDLFWELLTAKGLVEKCPCGATPRRYTECEDCGGSGHKAKEESSGPTEDA